MAKSTGIPVEKLREKVRGWYNGFRFFSRDISVYNPIALKHLLHSGEFKAYWFETGTPSFLAELMKKEDFAPNATEKLSCRYTDFSTYEVENQIAETGYAKIFKDNGKPF